MTGVIGLQDGHVRVPCRVFPDPEIYSEELTRTFSGRPGSF